MIKAINGETWAYKMAKIVVIVDNSAGNETIGEAWQETRIFDADTPVREIMLWAGYPKKRVQITVPAGEDLEDVDEIPF